ncbi:hypothetical protein NDU88_001558 [Pleurodeles waltl]|uniref:Uncharacterized protein n=1 Tax=Pleurodeles waltl TaxID=8319 RepID=A0AAV7WL86_PLEWA|nr:hypothetical protein NDU88_001558 [Pleurodeles waltl]
MSASDGRPLLCSGVRALPSAVSVYSSSRLARQAPGVAGFLAPGHLKSSGSSVHDIAISSGGSALLRRRLHSGGASLLRIIARPRRSTRATRPTSWLP